ncbi:hypothetical protein N800_07920 [Lysobacter daejeonensis GH1-9]|uniref:SMODS and SLOG-associating 2TM effector domain-containing protein n=1 Tax=Lysobacter daejeonensis GH1-9 TaxID=1385517 RepID=A0A0A0ES44_9GAMM|nr:hypothetical protein [Lysobacter daejeonensis]KGM53309.1 hypothetical protein N800_07920 [Lysobacter daejeonensis GH1-9]
MPPRNGSLSPATSLLVGVTGHRKLREDELPALQAQVRTFLQDLQKRYPELPVVLLSSLAEGSDQLAAQVALDLGLQVIAPLPLPVELYRDDFEAEALATFERQLRQVHVLTLPLRRGSSLEAVAQPGLARDQQYAQAGIFVSSHCHILLALWDGRDSDRLGGTAQVVRFHLHGEMPGQIERRRAAATALGLDEETVAFHIQAGRAGAAPETASRGRWLTAGQALEPGADLPATFDLMFRRHAQFNADARRYSAAIAAQSAALPDSAPCPIQRVFHVADWLASTYQRRVNHALRITYVLAALMGFTFFTYTHISAQDVVIYGFLVLFLVGAGVVLLAKRGEWQRKYLDYRALAEGLRVQSYWRRAGIVDLSTPTFAHDNFLQKQDVELGWIRNVMRGASLDGMRVPARTGPVQVDAVIGDWIGNAQTGGQRHYYTYTAVRRARIHGRAELLGLCCLGLGVGISVLLAIFARQLDPHLKHMAVAAMGIVSVAAAVHEAYTYKKADKELIKQYRFMQRIFDAAQRRLNGCTELDEQRQVLRALGEAALAEHAEWTLMHRERPLQHTRI